MNILSSAITIGVVIKLIRVLINMVDATRSGLHPYLSENMKFTTAEGIDDWRMMTFLIRGAGSSILTNIRDSRNPPPILRREAKKAIFKGTFFICLRKYPRLRSIRGMDAFPSISKGFAIKSGRFM